MRRSVIVRVYGGIRKVNECLQYRRKLQGRMMTALASKEEIMVEGSWPFFLTDRM